MTGPSPAAIRKEARSGESSRRTRTPPTGCRSLTIRRWPAASTADRSRWLTSRLFLTRRLCTTAAWPRHIHRRDLADLADLLDRLAATLLAGHLTGQQLVSLVSLINYLVQAGETDDAEAFVRNLAQRVPQHEDELMTIAQQLEQKGIEKGRQEGIETGRLEGLQLGEQKGKLEVARNLLRTGMPLQSVKELTGLSTTISQKFATD